MQWPPASSAAHMLVIVSVRFVSKLRNCLPFFEKPFTSVSELTNILSFTDSPVPPANVTHLAISKHNDRDLPSLRWDIFAPGSVLNTICGVAEQL